MSSETSQARSVLAPYCVGLGIDIGFGGDSISPTTINLDLPRMYCPPLGDSRQHLRGDAARLDFVCSGAFDYVFSSHLIEDFYCDEQISVINEWRRILTPGGVLILNSVDQKKFEDHCHRTGQSLNDNHRELRYSFKMFTERVLPFTGEWQTVFEAPLVEPYSWYGVWRKA